MHNVNKLELLRGGKQNLSPPGLLLGPRRLVVEGRSWLQAVETRIYYLPCARNSIQYPACIHNTNKNNKT